MRGRARASLKGGYRRVTISIPVELFQRFMKHCSKQDGLTLSAFLTQAGKVCLESSGGSNADV